MSTATHAVADQRGIGCERDLHGLLCRLEADPSLLQPEQLHARLAALDDLDVGFGGPDTGFGGTDPNVFTNGTDSRIHGRAKALQARLEAANAEFYRSIRAEIIRGDQPRRLLQCLQYSASQSKDSTDRNEPESLSLGLGFDWRDELVSGILQFREPSESDLQRSWEMVPYQPTPVRHILDLLGTGTLSDDDLFVDLGSGLGHLPLLVSMLAGVRSLGIEVEAAYVARAQECAASLNLSGVQFMQGDAREADLSLCTVFYLYSPFTGSILTDVLRMLQMESTRKPITVCSLGPCTRKVAKERWLTASAPPDTERIAVFHSR
jgi:hypothetical protein